jgi:hypothetical protein
MVIVVCPQMSFIMIYKKLLYLFLFSFAFNYAQAMEKAAPNAIRQAAAASNVELDPTTMQTIDAIVVGEGLAGTGRVVPLNCQSYPDVQGNLVPSFQQGRALCGYYALFNAQMMLQGVQNLTAHREELQRFLRERLIYSAQLGHNIHEWRHVDELRSLVPREQNILVVEPAAFFVAARSPQVLQQQAEQAAGVAGAGNLIPALRRFHERQDRQIALAAFVGNNHWIAIHAMRQADDSVHLQVSDSMNGATCATDRAAFRKYILPFYYALTFPFDQWPAKFTTEYGREIDNGATAFLFSCQSFSCQEKII